VAFATLPGYSDLKTALLKLGASQRVPHALLFTGAPGTPVVPLALGFIQQVFCASSTPAGPCGTCGACSKIVRLLHPDLHLLFPVSASEGETAADDTTLDKLVPTFRAFVQENPFAGAPAWGVAYGAGNRQPLINVRDVRKLIGNLSLMSYEGGYKVAFIWLPELMNTAGANALLKMLEEPPDKTLFVLATYEQEALLATILSRVIQIRVRPAEDTEIEEILTQAGIPAAAISAALVGAEGSIARALELAQQQDLGLQDRFIEWMRACYGLQYADMVSQSEDFAKLGREGQKWMVSYALSVYRRLLRHKVAAAASPTTTTPAAETPAAETPVALTRFFDVVPLAALEPVAQHLEHLHEGIVRNAAPKLAYLSVSIKIGQALRQPN